MEENRKSSLATSANVTRGGNLIGGRQLSTVYQVECVRDGKVIWTDEFHNIVVTAGLNDSLDKHLKGDAYTAAWYVGLIDDTPTIAAADTMASHDGWVEVEDYDEATREALVLGSVSAGSVSNTASKASFTINDTVTVGGAFIVSDDAIGEADGVLYGAGAFTGGDRALLDEDVLNVTITLTAAAA